MTELRKRMIECLQLRGLSERTQEAYVRAVRQLSEHYHKSPDQITEEELRQYFLHLMNVKKYSRAASTIAICGIKFFFERTLEKDWTTFGLVRPPREKKLPVVLSIEEVQKILGCIRLPRYRVCLTTIYSCGLRLQEGIRLQVRDIDSARMMIQVRHGICWSHSLGQLRNEGLITIQPTAFSPEYSTTTAFEPLGNRFFSFSANSSNSK